MPADERIMMVSYKESTKYYRDVKAEYCCQKMEEEWDDLIRFSNPEDSDNRTVNIVQFFHHEDMYEATRIYFCPFCGAKIELKKRV